MSLVDKRVVTWEALPSSAVTPAGQTWIGFRLKERGALAEFRLVDSKANKRVVKPSWASSLAFPFLEAAAKAPWISLASMRASIARHGFRRIKKVCAPYCDEHRFAYLGVTYAGCLLAELLRRGGDVVGQEWQGIAPVLVYNNGIHVPGLTLRHVTNGTRYGLLAPMKADATGLPVLEVA